MPSSSKREHKFNAQARLLTGNLQMPVAQTLYPAGPAQLDETGGYQCCRANDHRVEGVVAFASGYSQVSGGEIQKPSGGWSTISTTVIEGLNILEVVTADRIVGQIITEHPAEGYVPRISFLGTRFENLRIAGHPVHLELALDILGEEAPADDGSYTQDRGVISRISSQYKAARGKKPPSELAGQFDELKSTIGNRDAIEGSLISQLETSFPGQFFNHVIRIRDFGTITLAKLRVEHEDFHPKKGSPKKTTVKLTMIECKLGCAIAGAMDLAEPSNNGTTQP